MWKKSTDLAQINAMSAQCAVGHMGIEITEIGVDYLVGTMPVDHRTQQPFGLLHGGASVVLAETLGSLAGNLCVDDGFVCVGLEVNANHLRAVRQGKVTGVAKPLQLGRTVQVWQIDIQDEQNRPVCTSRLTLVVKPIA